MQPKDLHDFEDVAQNYDLYPDVMYKNEEKPNGFPDFYLDFAKAYGQEGVIDIACGTGAVLLYLAQHGIRADGTDLSEAMCRVADRKAKQMGFDLNIFPADMTTFRSERKYSCAIIARSGFMHLPTPALQRAALLKIRGNRKRSTTRSPTIRLRRSCAATGSLRRRMKTETLRRKGSAR